MDEDFAGLSREDNALLRSVTSDNSEINCKEIARLGEIIKYSYDTQVSAIRTMKTDRHISIDQVAEGGAVYALLIENEAIHQAALHTLRERDNTAMAAFRLDLSSAEDTYACFSFVNRSISHCLYNGDQNFVATLLRRCIWRIYHKSGKIRKGDLLIVHICLDAILKILQEVPLNHYTTYRNVYCWPKFLDIVDLLLTAACKCQGDFQKRVNQKFYDTSFSTLCAIQKFRQLARFEGNPACDRPLDFLRDLEQIENMPIACQVLRSKLPNEIVLIIKDSVWDPPELVDVPFSYIYRPRPAGWRKPPQNSVRYFPLLKKRLLMQERRIEGIWDSARRRLSCTHVDTRFERDVEGNLTSTKRWATPCKGMLDKCEGIY